MFDLAPVKKLSAQITSQPSASKRSTKCEPRNPAPPVTSTLFFVVYRRSDREFTPRSLQLAVIIPMLPGDDRRATWGRLEKLPWPKPVGSEVRRPPRHDLSLPIALERKQGRYS